MTIAARIWHQVLLQKGKHVRRGPPLPGQRLLQQLLLDLFRGDRTNRQFHHGLQVPCRDFDDLGTQTAEFLG